MSNLRWIERVGRKLVHQGLPQGYVRRVVGELRDHHQELLGSQAAGHAADADDEPAIIRLGNPNKLAGVIAGQFRRQHFSGRHPVLSFLAAPLLLMILGWSLLPLSLVGCGWVCESVLGIRLGQWVAQRQTHAQAILNVWQNVVLIGTPAAAAVLVCYWARRSAVSRSWLIAACTVTAILAFAMQVEIVLPTAPGNGRLAMGLGLTTGMVRMMVPVLISFWAVTRLPAPWTDAARVEPTPAATIRRAA